MEGGGRAQAAVPSAPRLLDARAALHVDDGDRPVVDHPPARALEAVAPVEVLHVDPIGLVEQADLGHGGAADEHERAVDRVDVADVVLADVGGAVLGQGAGGGRPPAHAREVRQGAQRRRERALGRVVEGPVGLHEPAAGHADRRVGVHEGDHVVQGARRHDRVGVQQQRVGRRGAPEHEVVRDAEPRVPPERLELDLGKVGADHVRGAVGARVVDDVDGHGAGPQRVLAERRQAGTDVLPRACPGDDDDVEHTGLGVRDRHGRRLELMGGHDGPRTLHDARLAARRGGPPSGGPERAELAAHAGPD